MDNIIKQLKKGAKHIRLSVSEKSEMKSVLLRHVKMNPVRVEDTLHAFATSNGAGSVRTNEFARHQLTKGDRGILSPFQINNLRSKKNMPLLIMLGLLMGGSASFAAENTVPGDVLYPVKVHVNENVRGALTVTPKAKAEWEVRLVERRLEEVEKLAEKPNVPAQVGETAQANLAAYTERVKERIAKLEDENDSEDAILAAGELADMFRTHEGVIAGLSTQVTGATATLGAATSTASMIATSTAGSTASTTPVAGNSVSSAQSLVAILSQLRADRGDAEKKHQELEHKYHPESSQVTVDGQERNIDKDETETSIRWAPAPAVNTATGTTTTASTSTPAVTPAISSGEHEGPERSNNDSPVGGFIQSEVRPTAGAVNVTPTAAPASVAVPSTEHAEVHVETSRTTESTRVKDND